MTPSFRTHPLENIDSYFYYENRTVEKKIAGIDHQPSRGNAEIARKSSR